MNQTLNTPLNALLPRLLRIGGSSSFSTSTIIQTKPSGQLLHLVRVTVLLVAGHAEVEVVADGAVVARLHSLGAGIAVVDKLVLALNTLIMLLTFFTNHPKQKML